MRRSHAPRQCLVPLAQQPTDPHEEPSLPVHQTAQQQQNSTQQVLDQLGFPETDNAEAANQYRYSSSQEADLQFDQYSLPEQQHDAQPDNRDSRKRPRDDQPADQAEPSEEPEVMDGGIAQLICTIPTQHITQLHKALSKIHTANHASARQIKKMEQAQKDEKLPAGWKIQTLHLPAGSSPLRIQAEKKMVEAYVSCYSEMITAREAAIEAGRAESTKLMGDTATAQ